MRFNLLLAVPLLAVLCAPATAQRHSGGSSPPTAPPTLPRSAMGLVGARGAAANSDVRTGSAQTGSPLGTLQFIASNQTVPAPQSLTRQLQSEDERTRMSSLAVIGAPAQYLNRGHVPFPRTVQLNFVALGNSPELDAVLTVELDQHFVSAILRPDGADAWRRVATVIDAVNVNDPAASPANFLRIVRSLDQPDRYRIVYRSIATAPSGDFTEHESHVRVINGRAVVTLSFVSSARTCDANRPRPCEIVHRWLKPDPTDPTRRFLLVTGMGRLGPEEVLDPLTQERTFMFAHLHNFSCQPFMFSESSLRFEASGASTSCPAAP